MSKLQRLKQRVGFDKTQIKPEIAKPAPRVFMSSINAKEVANALVYVIEVYEKSNIIKDGTLDWSKAKKINKADKILTRIKQKRYNNNVPQLYRDLKEVGLSEMDQFAETLRT